MVDVSKRPKKRPEGLGAKKSNPEKSLRPVLSPADRDQSGLAEVEARADFDPALSWNPIARLGFEGYNTDKVTDFQFTPEVREQARRQNLDLTSFNPDMLDNAFYTSSTASKKDVEKELATHGVPAEVRVNTNPDDIVADVDTATPSTWAHEMTHRGFDRIIESINKHPEGPSAGIKDFKEKYGERAFSLLTEVDNEIVTEGFDYLEDKVLGYKKPEDTLKRDAAGIKEMQKTLKADPEDRWEHNERKYEPYLKLMEAAQDILTASGEPPKSPKYEESMMDKLRIKLGFAEGGYASYEDNPMGLDDQMQGIDFGVPSAPVEDKPVSPMSRRPGFRGESSFDFSGFGDFLKENVSEEEVLAGLDNAGQWMVPFYEAGSNLTNVIGEYTKPEEERDYDYIKEELGKAGESAAIEGAMWLLGGVATKYGGKGVKYLYDKVKQYEIDPNVTSAFGVGAITKKESNPLEIGINKFLEDGKFLKNYNADTAATMAENSKRANAGNKRANALINAEVPEGTRVGVRLNLNSTIPDSPKGLDKLQTLHKGSFNGQAMSYLPFATVRNVSFNVSQKGRTAIASRIKGIDTPEAKAKYPAMSVDGDYVPNKNLLDEGGDLVEIGLNPANHHLFIDLKTGQAVKGAEEATVIGDRVYARGVEYWKKAEAPAPLPTQSGEDILSDVRYKFNQGGMAMDDQMQLMFKSSRTGYALGGEVDAIDPVSGNEVPPGATEQEVRDDITIQVSQGEYVVPADVTRYYGIKFFEDLRNNAKVEMSGLQEDGRIGGQPISEDPDELTEDEMAILQEVMSSEEQMGMAIGGTVAPVEANIPDPYQQQATMYSSKPMGMATGGVTQLDPFGNPISPTAASSAPAVPGLTPVDTTSGNIYGLDKSEQTTPTVDIPVGGPTTGISTTTPDTGSEMKTVFFIHKDGRRISVLMLGSRPISSVPADFTEFVEDTPENRAKIGFGETAAAPATAGATEKVDTNDDQDQTDDIDIKTKVDPNTPEGVKAMYDDSGVNLNDPLAGAKSALEGKIGVSKELGALAGAINPFLGVAAGVANAASQLTALSKAQANLKMAEFLGKDDDAAAIQVEIDKFLKDAPKVVTMFDDIVAKGDRRFNNALEATTSMKASEDTPQIFYDELSEKGKANVNKYIEDSTEGYTVVTGKDTKSTIDNTPLREGTLVKTSTKDTGESLGGTKIGTDKTGTVNVYTPTASTPRPVVRPDTTTPTTTSTSKPSSSSSSNSSSLIGTDAGDGMVWAKSSTSNALVRVREPSTSSSTTTSTSNSSSSSSSSSDSSSSSEGGKCFLTTAIVDRRGEADNGPTLTKLRNFRDTYMAAIPADVEEYYRVAPQIVASIPADHKDWDWIGSQVDKSVEFIDNNLLNDAYRTYKAMVKKLEKDWL